MGGDLERVAWERCRRDYGRLEVYRELGELVLYVIGCDWAPELVRGCERLTFGRFWRLWVAKSVSDEARAWREDMARPRQLTLM